MYFMILTKKAHLKSPPHTHTHTKAKNKGLAPTLHTGIQQEKTTATGIENRRYIRQRTTVTGDGIAEKANRKYRDNVRHKTGGCV